LAFVILGDDGEGGQIGSVGAFETRSEHIEFGWIRIGVAAIDGDVPGAA